MRQGQQNRRGRGRSNHQNHRKGQNPLTRSFESTGPDVKIRGTPAHIAEKYMTLARDAHSSGDPVLAENYLQHAEHYNRIIMAYREQQTGPGGEMANGQPGRYRFDSAMGSEEFGDETGEEFGGDVQPQPPIMRGQEPQPRSFEGQRADDRGQRPGHEPHRHHHRERDPRGYPERVERQDRPDRHQRPERGERTAPTQAEPVIEGNPPRPRERSTVPHHEQPEFLRRPVRRPRREGNGSPTEDEEPSAAAPVVEDTGRD